MQGTRNRVPGTGKPNHRTVEGIIRTADCFRRTVKSFHRAGKTFHRALCGVQGLFVDEMRRFVPSRADLVPWEVDQIFREGRAVGLETVLATQYPRDYSKNISEEVSEWICFNINEPDNLDAVRPYFAAVDRVAGLKRGEFIAYNRESGAELAGKVF